MTSPTDAPTLPPRRPVIPIARAWMKFTDLRVETVSTLAFEQCSPLTIEQYEVCYGQFASYLERHDLNDDIRHFTDEHIRAFAKEIADKQVRANTVRSKLSALRTMARVAMALDGKWKKYRLIADPTKTFRWPKGERHRSMPYPYMHELAAIWTAPCTPALDIARELLIDMGARVSSLVNATVGDLEERPDGVYLRLHLKGGAEECKPMSEPAARKLRDYLWQRNSPDPGERLLVRDDGQPWNRTALSEAIARLSLRAGVRRFRVSAHKLRHANSVYGRGAGLDAETRARLLGHSAEVNRAIYDHEIPGEMSAARNQARRHMDAEVKRVMGEHYSEPESDVWEWGGNA